MNSSTARRSLSYLFQIIGLTLLLALALPGAMLAQQYSGTIIGTVTDPGGASVSGAGLTA